MLIPRSRVGRGRGSQTFGPFENTDVEVAIFNSDECSEIILPATHTSLTMPLI